MPRGGQRSPTEALSISAGTRPARCSKKPATAPGWRSVAHAMIPVALEEGGSLVVLPTVAGFLFALYLALTESFV